MLRPLGLLFFLSQFAFQSLLAQAPKNQKQTEIPVFTVASNPVTTDEFIYLYKKNHQNKSEDFTQKKVEEYLNLFINFKLKVTEAKKRGLDTTAAFIKEFNTYKDELRKPYLPDNKLLDSLVLLTYNRMKEEVNASHILIKVSAGASPTDSLAAFNKINELRNRALAGEDFGELAATYSEDPSAKMNKGNLGYFTGLQMVYPFENGAYETKKGEISKPLRTSFGYHIIKVNDRRPASGEVEVSHIMIRTGENADNNEAKNKIFDIYDQLQKGVNWNDLAKEFSEDPSSKNNGGKLRPFGMGAMASVPEFEEVSFNLKNPGDISDPFQTQFGWHIVKLERKIPVPSFQEISASLKNRVARDERVQVSKNSVYSKIKKEYGYIENTEIKAQVIKLADTTLNAGVWKMPSYNNAEKQSLFTLDGKSYSVKEFLEYAVKNQKPNMQEPSAYLGTLYNSFVETQLMNALEKKIIAQSPDYKWLLREYYEGILLFDIMEKEVWNKASEDSVGQQKYFSEHTQNYKAGERIRGNIYSATTKEHLDQLKTALDSKDSVKAEELIRTLKIKQESGAYEKADRIILSKIDWSTGTHLTMNNNNHYLVKVDEILKPGLKTFEEARPEVISDYQNFLEAKWIDELKKKYQVKINKKGKSYVFDQLVTTK